MSRFANFAWVALAFGSTALAAEPAREEAKDAFAYARLLGRGINLGNGLDAPKEGDWGYKIEAEHFKAIRKAGFDSVRIPIRWSAHADAKPPYAIDATFFRRVDTVLDQALEQGLAVVLNVHHYDEIYRDPDKHAARLAALWRQIAERYRDRSDKLLFELLNEPNSALTDERWQKMFPDLLKSVRATNPKRAVVIGPGQWNNVDHLKSLKLPDEDRMLIATFHYYSPFEFTHQGASWAKGSDKWKGRKWEATTEQLAALRRDFDKAATWSKQHNRPIYLGEFGAYSAADMASRETWTRAIVREAEARKFAWAYWEFASGFGAYDAKTKQWREPLRRALVGK